MRFHIAAIAAAVAAFAPCAVAADDDLKITNPKSVIEEVTAENASEIIREIGGQNVEVQEVDGSKVVTFTNGDVPYNATVSLCGDPPAKCVGLTLFVLVEKGDYSYEVLNKWNTDTSFLTLFKLDDKKLGVGRVELTEGGVTKMNLALAVVYFVVEFEDMLKQLQSQLTASVQPDNTFKPTGLDTTQILRPVKATPEELARVAKMLPKLTRRSLHPSK